MKRSIFNRYFLLAVLSLGLAGILFYDGFCKIFDYPASPLVGPASGVFAVLLVVVGWFLKRKA